MDQSIALGYNALHMMIEIETKSQIFVFLSGHFLLTNLLLETMKDTSRQSKKEGRIVIVSSEAHRFTYKGGINFDKINDESR